MIRIQTLGGLSVRGDDGRPLSGSAAQPRRMAVLAMLARAGDRGVARERIVTLLWPDAEEDRARNNLAQALYALRRDLGSEDAIAGTKELRLDPDHVSSDVDEFCRAVTRGEAARAAQLYAGPFLDGFHVPGAAELARWVDDERRALAHDYAHVLESLARAATAGGNPAAASTWWRKLAATDPLNARVAIGLMEALAAAGDRAGALHHARIYEALLEQELDLPPDRDVVRLADRLRREADDGGAPAAAPRSPAVAVAEPPPKPSTLAAARAAAAPPAATAPVPGASPALATAPSSSIEEVEGAEPTPAAASVGVLPAAEVAVAPAPTAPPGPPADTTPPVSPPPSRGRRSRRFAITAGAVASLAGVGAIAIGLRDRIGRFAADAPTAPVVAVGRIAGYELGTRPIGLTAPLADLLATNLARVPGLRVVSSGRMLEIIQHSGAGADTSAGALVAAARAAGATELVDGTLYGRPGGRLRLDLRRVDLATGAIVDVRTVEGPDLFALVDSGTAQLAARLGASAPAGSVADMTTRSLAAYRLYVAGLRRYYSLDYAGAEQLLGAAVAEDSTFAMAAYYLALATADPAESAARWERAVRLSATASDRERLTIRAGWALRFSAPELAAIADTLATRYPDQVEGHLYRGAALLMAQEFLAAVPHLRRAMVMDSLVLRGPPASVRGSGCVGCDARTGLIFAYQAVDSLAAAEREARAWTRVSPGSPGAWLTLGGVLDLRGQHAAALAAFDSARRVGGGGGIAAQNALAVHWIQVGGYARAEDLLRARAESGTPADQGEALWYLAILYREQGRLADALTAARRLRVLWAANGPTPTGGAAPSSALMEAVVLEGMGRYREAAALHDSVSRGRVRGLAPSQYARNRAWGLTHTASALAAAGDTGRLRALADTVAAYGAQSLYGRDQRLHHHIRGLALAARGDDATAVEEFRASIRSPSLGYTRSNAELARVLLRLGRPREAVAVLQPALRGAIEASNLYVCRTELHELLAQAWEAAGARDSAAAHYATVASAWAAGDPPFRSRAVVAAARIAALSR